MFLISHPLHSDRSTFASATVFLMLELGVLLRYYKSLPPVSKAYGVACLMTTSAYYLQLYHSFRISLSYELVLKNFQVNKTSDIHQLIWPVTFSACFVSFLFLTTVQVWRLITNFFFLGPFSFTFAFRLLIM